MAQPMNDPSAPNGSGAQVPPGTPAVSGAPTPAVPTAPTPATPAPPNAQGNPPAPNPYIVTFQTGRPYHVHKSYIYVGPLVLLAAIIFFGGIGNVDELVKLGFYLNHNELPIGIPLLILCIVGALVVIFGILVGIYSLAYKNMTYAFDQRDLSFHSGIIMKKRVHLPYEKVQSVNRRASLVQRIFGVCTVTIDSAGGLANKSIRIPYVRLHTADRISSDLFVRRAAEAAGVPVVYAPEHDFEANAARVSQPTSAAGAPTAPIIQGSPSVPVGIIPNTTPPILPGTMPNATPPTSPGAMPNMMPPAPGTTMPNAAPPVPAGTMPNAMAPAPVTPPAASSNILDDALGPLEGWRGLYGGVGFNEAPVSYQYALTNGQLFLSGITHPGSLIAGFVVAICLLVMAGFGILAEEAVMVLTVLMIPVALGGALVIWVFTSLGIILGYGGFKACRRGTRIEVERGVITRHSAGIDIDRVQFISVKQSLIRRLLGYCEVSLGRINTSTQDSSQNKNSTENAGLVIHPFIKLNKVNELLDGLFPEFEDRPLMKDLTPLPKVALRRSLLRRCLWYNWVLWPVVILGICWSILAGFLMSIGELPMNAAIYDAMTLVFAIFVALVIVATAIFAISAVRWARRSSFGWNRRFLMLHNDGLSTTSTLIPRQKIQSGTTRDNPFQRLSSVTTLCAVTAANVGSGTTLRLMDVPAEAGATYLEWLQ